MELLNKILIFAIMLLFFNGCSKPVVESPLWHSLEHGQYDVGYKIIYVFDESRSFLVKDTTSHIPDYRPIRIMLWYPGKKNLLSSPMKFGDYINVTPDDDRFVTYNQILFNRDSLVTQYQFSPLSDSLFNILMNTPTVAFQEIEGANEKFPLILYATGKGDYQQENSVLYEYLASHGYIVAVLPQFGPDIDHLSIPWTGEGLESHLLDFEYALLKLRNNFNIDENKIGIIGHSYGGLVAWQLAIYDKSIKTAVALDGSNNRSNGLEVLNALNSDPSDFKIPFLNIYTLDNGDRTLDLVNSANSSDRFNIRFINANHYDFQNWPLYSILTNTIDHRSVNMRRTREEGKDIYMNTVKLIKLFLDGTLGNNEEVLEFFKENPSILLQNTSMIEFQYLPRIPNSEKKINLYDSQN